MLTLPVFLKITAYELIHQLGFDQKRVVAEIGVDQMILDRAPDALQRRDEIERLFRGVQPVAAEADDQKLRPRAGQRIIEAGIPIGDIEVIQRFGDVQIAVGVETLDKFLPLVLQVALHGKFRDIEAVGDPVIIL